MLEGINYLHAKFQINIFRNKKVIKLLELWTLWKRKEKKNSEYNRVVITTLKTFSTKKKRKKTLSRPCYRPRRKASFKILTLFFYKFPPRYLKLSCLACLLLLQKSLFLGCHLKTPCEQYCTRKKPIIANKQTFDYSRVLKILLLTISRD